MTTDPAGGGDDLESRKTRFVPRPDVVEGGVPGAPAGNRLAPEGEDVPSDAPAPAPPPGLGATQSVHGFAPAPDDPQSSPVLGGTVIGRTRLVGRGNARRPGHDEDGRRRRDSENRVLAR
jgi:hypothetical protein